MTCLNTGSCGFVNIGFRKSPKCQDTGEFKLLPTHRVISRFNRNRGKESPVGSGKSISLKLGGGNMDVDSKTVTSLVFLKYSLI